MNRLASLTITGAICMAAASCAANDAPSNGLSAGESNGAKVEVVNNNWSDMTIFADRGGVRVRLGTVTSFDKKVFSLPQRIINSGTGFQLVASPLASRSDYQTNVLNVFPGQTIEFRVENHLAVSTVSIW